MNVLFSFFLFLNTFFLWGQESIVTKLDTTIYKNYSSLKANTIYSFNDRDFNYLIHQKDKKLKLVYTFDISCHPCRVMLPGILKIANEHKEYLDFYIIISEKREKELKRVRTFFKNNNSFNRPLFNPLNNKGNQQIQQEFLKKILPGYKKYQYRLPLLILYNIENKAIYASNYDKLTDLGIVKKLINVSLIQNHNSFQNTQIQSAKISRTHH